MPSDLEYCYISDAGNMKTKIMISIRNLSSCIIFVTLIAIQRWNKSTIIFRELKSYYKPVKHIRISAGHTKFKKKLPFYLKWGKKTLSNAHHRHFVKHNAFLRRQRRRLIYRRLDYKNIVFPVNIDIMSARTEYFKVWATTARFAVVF